MVFVLSQPAHADMLISFGPRLFTVFVIMLNIQLNQLPVDIKLICHLGGFCCSRTLPTNKVGTK